MKLASLKSGRDGHLVVVSRDLKTFMDASKIAPTLQAALDDWNRVRPMLEVLSNDLNAGDVTGEPFDASACASPLPRAYQWADGSAYVNHVELVRKARGAEMPESFWTDPLMYQGGSDSFLGPRDDIVMGDEAWGIDFEGEVAVVTDDVAQGTGTGEAGEHIQLLMLVNDAMRHQEDELADADTMTAAEMLRAVAIYKEMTAPQSGEDPAPADHETSDIAATKDDRVTPISRAPRNG